MQYTRKQIIEYLRTHTTASVPELSKALSLTLSNIRHHIRELESQQILEQAGSEPPSGRGRPVLQYRLTTRALEDNLVSLATALLVQTTGNLDADQRRDFYQQLARQMTAQVEMVRTPTQQIQQAIQWLNNHHYQARWEASATGPRITLAHCPYLALLPDYPSMCQLDTAIISELNKRPMSLTNQQTETHHHPYPCIFTTKIQGRS
jgi:predicted ArsR family transcriptional regulator